MKRLMTAIFSLAIIIFYSCKREDYLLYDDTNRVQFNDTSAVNETFVYDDASVVRDTVYLQVNTIGQISDQDRPVRFKQVQEYVTTYTTDPATGKVTDSTISSIPYTAVPGIHYLPLNDPSIVSLMVVKADSVHAMIPVILLRDTSLKTNSYRLHIELAANDAFGLGEQGARQKTIIFSDHLERFFSWRVDNYTATAYVYFGNYSTGKHRFMIDVLHTNIDEEWYQAAASAGALQQYKLLVKEALSDFNSDPENIASGKAPLRATDDPNSPVVTFP